MMSDPLSTAISATLWPFLRAEGFRKITSRKFVRERNEIFQQFWVDANGSGGSKNTVFVLCASLPFGPVNGYMDPHGFRIANGRAWNMATLESANDGMLSVVEALRSAELPKLDSISGIQLLLDLLESAPNRNWHSTYCSLHQRWLNEEPDALACEKANRTALKLS